MQNRNKITHLEKLCVIHADFDIWSGQTRLAAADLKLGKGGEIPPEKLAQLGSKRICDPSYLKGFHRVKTETRRLLLKYGMPFMNGFAVPVSKADEILERLSTIKVEFETLKNKFISQYTSAVNEWIAENPEYEEAIRTGALPKEAVEKRIGFEYEVFMIQPISDSQELVDSLSNKISRLGDDLISEVVQEADKFYLEKMAGRDQCSVVTRRTLGNIRDKLDGLSFLNGNLVSLVKLLDDILAGYETHAEKGNIVAPFFYQVMSAVLIMSDRKKIKMYADGSLTVDKMVQTLPGVKQAALAVASNGIEGVNTSEQTPVEEVTKGLESSPVEVDAGPAIADSISEDLAAIDSFFNNLPDSPQANAPEDDGNAVEEKEQEQPAPVMPDLSENQDGFF